MVNIPAKEIQDLRDENVELKIEIDEWKQKPDPHDDYDEMMEAIHHFCYDCPLKDSVNCATCYLNKWKEEKYEQNS